jgi:hypothetical protein
MGILCEAVIFVGFVKLLASCIIIIICTTLSTITIICTTNFLQ